MYDSVAWDSDGVLVDSRAEAWRVASEILALFGVRADIRSQEAFRHYFTQARIVGKRDTGTLRAMHRLVMQSRAHLLAPFPCLAVVGHLRVPSDIVTSGSAVVARRVLGDQAALFRSIRGHESGGKDTLLRAVSPNAVFVTDTVVDVARCREQSRAVIAVGWGYDLTEELRRAGPDHLVESSAQLEELFARLGLLKGVSSSSASTPRDS